MTKKLYKTKKYRSKRIAHKKSTQSRLTFIISIVLGALVFIGLYKFTSTTNAKPFCANSISCINDLSGKYEPNQIGVFMGQKVVPPAYLAETPSKKEKDVLGETEPNNKHIYVDLTTQHLWAKDGDVTVMDFPISSGKWHYTPTGDYKIWIKLRYTRMSGGDPKLGTYYDLPNVPFTMYFYNDQVPKTEGYSLHGTYWHNNFGHPMSHGCINISIPNAMNLYNWANPTTDGNTTYATSNNPGTAVTIYGTTPAS